MTTRAVTFHFLRPFSRHVIIVLLTIYWRLLASPRLPACHWQHFYHRHSWIFTS